MDMVSVLVGFLAGLLASVVTVLFTEHVRETRRRITLLRIVEWQLWCLITALRKAEQTEIWDSFDVESFATYIRETYLGKPELLLAARRQQTRTALEQIYSEVSGLLGLLQIFRAQKTRGHPPTAIDRGTYEGLAKRCQQSLETLRRARWWVLVGR
jgi:hypothetical protein